MVDASKMRWKTKRELFVHIAAKHFERTIISKSQFKSIKKMWLAPGERDRSQWPAAQFTLQRPI